MELPKAYNVSEEEKKWQEFWKKENIFKFDTKSKKPIYSIDTPPPTVSGNMHLGHAFSYSQQDFVVRFRRMHGSNVFFPFGTDDNGLPTERLVEKLKKVKSTKMDRQDFVKLCDKTIKEIKPEFVKDWIKIGMSCDFDGSYSTIDPYCQKTSQSSFIDLFEKELVFQEESPISWCTNCQTAIAQAEFESVDMKSHFNDIIFKCGGKDLIIATTRPELLPSCVGLFANPEDDRYKGLKDKFAKVPLFDYDVPILFDEAVDPKVGTGLMMVCTFGDKEDIEKWHKYDLQLKVAITKDGKMNQEAGKYKGLSIKEARKSIIEDLKNKELLINQKDLAHPVNVHDKCGTELEFLKTKQWFVRVLDKKNELIKVADKINWYPAHMKVRYVHWVENLNWNWCISRQRHFGVPFPVWYCKKCGKIMLADKDQLPVDPLSDSPKSACSCGSKEFVPEADVMDTWATSSVTPQIATNWVDKGKYDIDFKKAFPMSLRPQGHDIIRTWAFYTIVKALYNNENIPWEDIVISGHALDPHGKKMSKSKGNAVSPQDMIKKYGADALRFWSAGSKLGEDLPFQEKDLVTGKKMIVKLWNASKFTIMQLEGYKPGKDVNLEMADKWLLSKLNKIVKECTENFEKYEYSRTKALVENFFWHDFCDNYLEIVKDRVYNPDKRGEKGRLSGQFTLYISLLTILKLLAPIMPHITESIYQLYFKEFEKVKSIHISDWPEVDNKMNDEKADAAGEFLSGVITDIRKAKSEKNLSLKTPVKHAQIKGKIFKDEFEKIKDDLIAVANIEELEFEELDEKSEVDFECEIDI